MSATLARQAYQKAYREKHRKRIKAQIAKAPSRTKEAFHRAYLKRKIAKHGIALK
jgi:hypothetical protein